MPKKKSKHHKLASTELAFGETITTLAKTNKSIFVVDVDLKSSLKLGKFASKYPKRFIECGVAESNAAGISSGLSKSGKTVFLTSYACFSPAINWAVIKQSVCYNHNPIIIVGSRAGLTTSRHGATHQMLEDIALMKVLPNMQVFAPADAIETKLLLKTVVRSHIPSYIRLYEGETPVFTDPKNSFTIGKSYYLAKGRDVTILGHGPVLFEAVKLTGHSLDIINCSSIKPLDSESILKSVKKTGVCLVIEDHQKVGGLGESVASLLLTSGIHPKFKILGIDNRFGQSSHNYNQLWSHYGISQSDIINSIDELRNKS